MSGGAIDRINGICSSEIKTKLSDCFPASNDPNKLGEYRGLRYYDSSIGDDVVLPTGKICFSDFESNSCLPTCVFNSPLITYLQHPVAVLDTLTGATQRITAQASVTFRSQPGSCPQHVNEDPGFIWQVKAPGGRFENINLATDSRFSADYTYAQQGQVSLNILNSQNTMHNYEFRMLTIAQVLGTTNFDIEGEYDSYTVVASSSVYSTACKLNYIVVGTPGNPIITGTLSSSGPLSINYCVAEDEYRGGGTYTFGVSSLFIGVPVDQNWTGYISSQSIEVEYLDGGTIWTRFRGDPNGADYPVDASITVDFPTLGRADGSIQLESRTNAHEGWSGGGIYFSGLEDWYTWANALPDKTGYVRAKVNATITWTHLVTGQTTTTTREKIFGGGVGLTINTQQVPECELSGPFISYIKVLDVQGNEIMSHTEGDTIIIEAKVENYMRDGKFTAKELYDDPNDPYDFGNSYSVVFIADNPRSGLDQLFGLSNNGAAEVDANGYARFTITTEKDNRYNGERGIWGDLDGTIQDEVRNLIPIKGGIYAGYKIGALPHPPLAFPFAECNPGFARELNRSEQIYLDSDKQKTGSPMPVSGHSVVDEGGEVNYYVWGRNVRSWDTSFEEYQGYNVLQNPFGSFSISDLNDTDDLATGNRTGSYNLVYNNDYPRNGKDGRYEARFTVITRDDPDHYDTKRGQLSLFNSRGFGFGIPAPLEIINTNSQYTTPTFGNVTGGQGYCIPDGTPVEEIFYTMQFLGDGSYINRSGPFNDGNTFERSWHDGVPDEFSDRLEFFMTPQEIMNMNSQLFTHTYVNDEAQIDPVEDRFFTVIGQITVNSGILFFSATTDDGYRLGPEMGFWMGGTSTYSVKDNTTGEVFNAVGNIRLELGADHFRDRPCPSNPGNPDAGTFLRWECRDATGNAGTVGFELYKITADGVGGEIATFERSNDTQVCNYDDDPGGNPETNYPECQAYWNAIVAWWEQNGGVLNAPTPPFTNDDYGCTNEELGAYLTELYDDTTPEPYGTYHSATCGVGADQYTRYTIYHDGVGGYYTLTTYNSPLCGYTQYPPAGTFLRWECGDTEFTRYNRYKVTANGTGGEIRVLEEANSLECNFVPPEVPNAGTVIYSYCGGDIIQGPFGAITMPGTLYTFYEVIADGQGGVAETRETPNSEQCGYTAPPDDPGHPEAGTPSGQPYCGTGSLRYNRYQKYHDGNGGTTTRLIEANSEECGYEEPPNNTPNPGDAAGEPFCASSLGAYNTYGEFAQLQAYYNTTGTIDLRVIEQNSTECGYEDSSGSGPGTPAHPEAGTPAGDPYCGERRAQYNLYQRQHDGSGGYIVALIEENSTQCGYTPPVKHPEAGSPSGGTYCGTGANEHTKYQNYHDGSGGTYASVVEENSADCGYTAPPPPVTNPDKDEPAGNPFCASLLGTYNTHGEFAQVQAMNDGNGGIYIKVIDRQSTECGYTDTPTYPANGTASGQAYCGTGAEKFNRYQNVHDGSGGTRRTLIEENSTECGYVEPVDHPAEGSASGEAYCGTGSNQFTLYQNFHDGNGGTYTSVVQTNSRRCGYVAPGGDGPGGGLFR